MAARDYFILAFCKRFKPSRRGAGASCDKAPRNLCERSIAIPQRATPPEHFLNSRKVAADINRIDKYAPESEKKKKKSFPMSIPRKRFPMSKFIFGGKSSLRKYFGL